MGILDGIVEWIAEQTMAGLDLVTTSVLGALGCDMTIFLRYFPAAETMYGVFVALAVGIILLNWVWQLFKNFGLGAGIKAEDPVKLSIGASQTTSNIWKSWCRMLGGQIFLLLMNAWCLRLFTSMVGSFISNPLSL